MKFDTMLFKDKIILFDGHCNLCNGMVKFIIERDPTAKFKFVALQSSTAQQLLQPFSVTSARQDTFYLIDDGKCYSKSEAALRIAGELEGGWRHSALLRIIPRYLRDAVYNVIAAYRYRWFGRQDSCMVPTPDIRRRFL